MRNGERVVLLRCTVTDSPPYWTGERFLFLFSVKQGQNKIRMEISLDQGNRIGISKAIQLILPQVRVFLNTQNSLH